MTNMTTEQLDTVLGKLVQLQYDPYTQIDLYDEVVWSVTATMQDGSTKEITLTSVEAGLGWQLSNPFQYRLFTEKRERVFWEHISTIQ